MEGFGGKQWRIEIDSNMKMNPYITLEEVTNNNKFKGKLKLLNAEFSEGAYIIRLFDDNGFQNTTTITKYDMIDDPVLFHYINSRKPIDFTDFDSVSNHVMNKGLTSKLDIYNMIEPLFYRYMKHYESELEWTEKKILYASLRSDIDKYKIEEED